MKKIGNFYILFSILAFSPMNSGVTISTQALKIFIGIVFPILIYMMNTKYINVIVSAMITHDFSMYHKRFCKSFRHILDFRFHSSIEKIRAMPITKSFCSTLEINSANDDFRTKLTRMAFNTSQRTVLAIFFIISRFVSLTACFTDFIICNIFIGFPSTFPSTIKFSNSFASVFPRECIFTTQTFIHKYTTCRRSIIC